jgi:hypothetical protein
MGDRYTLQNGGSVVTLVFGGGLFKVKLPCQRASFSGNAVE